MQELDDIHIRLTNLIPTQPMIFNPEEFEKIQKIRVAFNLTSRIE